MLESKAGRVWAGIIGLVISATVAFAQFATGFQTLPTNMLDPAFWTEPKHLFLMIPAGFAGLSAWVLIATLFNPPFDKKAGEALAEKAETIHETTVNEGAAGRQRTAQAERAIVGQIERSQEEINAKVDILVEQNKGLAEELHISKAALIAIVKRVAPDFDDLDAATLSIRELVRLARNAIDEGARAHNVEAFVDLVLKRVAEKTAAGDFEGAADETDGALAQWEQQEAERANASRRNGIALLNYGIRQDLLAGRYDRAAEKEWRRIELENPGSEPAEIFDAAMARQAGLFDDGERKAGVLDLELALALARMAEDRAGTRESTAQAQNRTGSTLVALGERARGKAGQEYLADAVKAFEAALTVYRQEDMPADWAGVQNNLGNALRALGDRAGGEAGTAYLLRAVAAFEAALKVRTRDDMPVDWAQTQNNLGNALSVLGERAEREVGLGYLKEAVEAYEAALMVRTERGWPEDWAQTQHNLGNAFAALGERAGGVAGTTYLLDSVAAFEEALTVRTEEDMPVKWAMTLTNLGNALRALGEHAGGEAGAEFLLKAVAACKAALRVYTKDNMPVDWANTQNNIGNTFRTLGEHAGGEAGAKYLLKAVATGKAALKVFTKDDMSAQWAMTQNNIGIALSILGERTGGEAGADYLQRAVAAFEEALTVYTEQDMPADWAMMQQNMGLVRYTQWQWATGRAEQRDFAQAAIAHWQNALDVFGPDYFQASAIQRNIKGLKDWLAANPE